MGRYGIKPISILMNQNKKINGKIYLATCGCGMQYVGQTIQKLKTRWGNHKFNKSCTELYTHFQIPGHEFENFTLELLEENIFMQRELDKREIYWQIEKNVIKPNGLNLKLGGNTHEDTGQKISNFHLKHWKEKGRNAHNTAKIMEDKVEIIINLYLTGEYTQQNIADIYGVSSGTIGRVLKRDSRCKEISLKNHHKKHSKEMIEKQSQAQKNKPKSKSSKAFSSYFGVYFHKANKKWVATIIVNGIKIYIGIYSNEQEAAAAYNNYIFQNNITTHPINKIKVMDEDGIIRE